jgi:predicted small secreted protein
MRTFKTSLVLVALLSFGCLAIGCHTAEGLGEDMQSGGRAIEREAREERRD